MNETQKLEKHHAFHKIRAEKRFHYRGFDVCIGDSGRMVEPHPEYPGEFDHGYYESVYAIVVGDSVKFEQPLVFDLNHDSMWTDEARKKGRLAAAEAAAKSHIDTHLGMGFVNYA